MRREADRLTGGKEERRSWSRELAQGNSITKKEEILRVLASSLRPTLARMPADLGALEEIRLRIHRPLAVTWSSEGRFLSDEGQFCRESEAHVVTMAELQETMSYLSSYSRYAFEDKIRQGFLTIQGGHRIGLCGRTVLEMRAVKTISPITFINIRIARQILDCGREVFPWLWEDGRLQDTLVVSPPGLGKTTLLRDLIRLLAERVTVGVVDERSELAACFRGIPQNDLGPRTDVLDGCPKAEGMQMMVRSMAPQVIAVDEVGSEGDRHAVEHAMNCGCRILATTHGAAWEELVCHPVLGSWLRDGRFGRYVFMKRDVKTDEILYWVCDRSGKVLWRGSRGGDSRC